MEVVETLADPDSIPRLFPVGADFGVPGVSGSRSSKAGRHRLEVELEAVVETTSIHSVVGTASKMEP